MLRPKISQKECAELVADQIGNKRSQLDPGFYLKGVLLTGVEQLGKSEMIGNRTRKETAILLKSAFTPLFELLYEEGELPLVFALLISRGAAPTKNYHPLPESSHLSPHGTFSEVAPIEKQPHAEATYMHMLGEDMEVGLDGFPDGI
jgi:hypothetical protein